jgi:Ser/Thr protein kinase RdoA (MazF antagonist)
MSQTSAEPLKDPIEKFNQIANKAIQHFSFLAGSKVDLLNYSENATYLVHNPTEAKQKFILRVGRPGYHTKSEVESELKLLESIGQHTEITVSLPIPGDNQEYVQTVKHENEVFNCTLFTFLEGSAPEEDNESKLIIQFEILGKITAQLHEHSQKHHQNLRDITRLTWDYDTILGPEPKWGRWKNGKAITPERLELYEKVSLKIKERLDRFGKDHSRYGLIHSDLRLANLLVEGEEIKVIDFDDCGFGWYLYDLATSLSFIEHKSYVPSLVASWIKGYRKVRSLSVEEEQEIPTFIMMRRLQLIAWVGSRDNELTRELGDRFTIETDPLAKNYLENMTI